MLLYNTVDLNRKDPTRTELMCSSGKNWANLFVFSVFPLLSYCC